jgi:endonuclease/exonuclease/phosphatase family metal-dependent hydrolase
MVVVGTWNLENLFRPGSEFGPSDEPAYEAKLAALAGVIDRLAPDVLAVQEVGDPEALADLADSLDGDWETGTSTVFDAHHPIRVGVLSRLPLSDIEQPSQFPAPLAPVQVDDDGNTIDAMVRGALRVRVAAGGQQLDIVTCHLKSKLLSFPGGRFQPHDEGERARFAAYALDRRAAEAVTVRAYADRLLDGHRDERAVIVLGDLNDEPLAATTQILLRPPGSEIGTAGFTSPTRAIRGGCGTSHADPRGTPLHARLPRATGAARPHPRQPRTRHSAARRRDRRRATTIDHRDSERAPRRARIRPHTRPRPLRDRLATPINTASTDTLVMPLSRLAHSR